MSRAMKDSGVAWIGEIPEGWQCRPIKNGFTVYSGATPKSEIAEYWDGEIIWVTPADFKTHDRIVSAGKRNLTAEGYSSCGTTLVPPGSIVFSKRAPIGTVAVANTELCTNQGCLSCVPRDGVDTWFFYYTMSVFTEQFNLYGTGTTFKEISYSDFINFLLPIPPLPEQSHIAAFLDRRCAEIDRVIAATQRTIEEYKKLKQSIITEAVTHGVRGERKMKDSGVEWLGMIPENWSVYRIANVYDERNESGSDDLPILLVSINTGISDHEVSDDEQTRSFVRIEDRTKYKRVYPGDLAYNMMRAWQGAFGAARVDGMVSPAYVVAKPKGNTSIDSRYMEALLRSPSAIDEMHRFSHGITDFRLRLYWPEFKSIRICIPPYDEQIEIADYIDQRSAEIDRLVEAKQQLLAQLEAYKKSVIYEYVTGKKEVV